MRFVICWALTALAALPWVSGQDAGGSSSPASSALTQMPACGLRCLASAVANSTCSATNTTCVCTSGTITTQVTACVAVSCSVADSLVTKNVSNTICQIPSQDESNSYVNTTITLAVISNVLVLLRIGYKLFTRQELWWDDYLIIVVILAGIPSVIITAQGTTKNGLGKDVWTLTPTQITNFGYYFYFMEILYFLQLTLLKITLLCFYLRIFPATGVKRLLWATVGFTALWGSVFVLLAIFQCWPISFYWENWDGIHNGKCMNVNGLGWANAAISIALDIWMLAIPIWQVRSLQIHWKKKIGVSLMFFVGTFITVVSILRLQTLVNFAASTNPTMDNLMVSVWSTVEINVGIFCVCMPVLRLMLVRAVPILGSTNRSRLYGGGSRLKSNPSSHNRSRGLSNAIKHDGKGPSGDSKGIIYQQAYSVQYSTATDEEVLINMRDLELHTSKKQEASSNV